MKTLTDRKIAEQEQVTYETQRKAQEFRQTLKQATALADTQATVVDAERQVSIAEFKASAAVANAQGEAKAKTINAEADATVTRTVGEATAQRTRAIGTAEADVITQKIKSYGSGNYAIVQVAESLSKSGVKLVPDIVAGDGAGGGSLVNVLLGTMLRDMMAAKGREDGGRPS